MDFELLNVLIALEFAAFVVYNACMEGKEMRHFFIAFNSGDVGTYQVKPDTDKTGYG